MISFNYIHAIKRNGSVVSFLKVTLSLRLGRYNLRSDCKRSNVTDLEKGYYHFRATVNSQLFSALFHASNIQVCLHKLSCFLSKPINV